MITEYDYEWFIRIGYGSSKNTAIGANADIWRAYEFAYGEVIKNNPMLDLKIFPKELDEYNKQSIEVKNYILAALGKYREHDHLNGEQKEKLRLLQIELHTVFGIDTLVSVIQDAKEIMESKFEYNVKLVGEVAIGHFGSDAEGVIRQQRNFFGSITSFELTIVQVPFNSEYRNKNEFVFSEDFATCNATFYIHPVYDGKGVIISIVQPFEFRSTLGDFLHEIQSDLQQRAKGKK
jgi:hypothetical protein